ncbi:MAG TPA: hypothetical protein VK936_00565, partial [Longimicrobiales bacterium]|nr:hypothetical protein [Longimicrobiales bacterium]
PYGTPSSIAISRDGAVAVAAYGQNFALVWDLASGDLLAALGRDDLDSIGSRIYRVDIAPDARDMLVRRADGEIQVWDWRERVVRGSIRVPPEDGPWQADAARPVGAVTCGGGVGPAMFAGTGRWIAVAVANRVVVYDWPTGRQVNAWSGHQPHHPILGNHTGLPRILDLRVSADGHRALTVGVDASLRLWSVASGRQIWTDTPDVCCMDWGDLSADGRTVAWTGCPGTRLYSPRGA